MRRAYSEELTQQYLAKHPFLFRVKECWSNAHLLLTQEDLSVRAGWYYVEGYGVQANMPIPFEHGWVEQEQADGIAVVDVTWRLNHTIEQLVRTQYLPGVRYTLSEARRFGRTALPRAAMRHNRAYYDTMVEAHVLCFGEAARALFPPFPREDQ